MCVIVTDGKYSMPSNYIKDLDVKRPEFSLIIFKQFIFEKLNKYDVSPSQLVLKANYVFNTTGERFDKLRSFAEFYRNQYYKDKNTYFEGGEFSETRFRNFLNNSK